MSAKFQFKVGIREPGSDILLNWRHTRSEFGYTGVKRNVQLSLAETRINRNKMDNEKITFI